MAFGYPSGLPDIFAGLQGLQGYQQPQAPQMQQDEGLGFTLADFLPPEANQQIPDVAPQSRGDAILALLGHAAQNANLQPHGFGQGLISGLLGGLGGEGLRRESERAKLEAAQKQRQQTKDMANLEASRAYRNARVAVMSERTKEKARTTEKQADYLRTSVLVPPDAPQWVKRLADSNGRIPQDTLARALKPEPGQNIAALSPAQAQLLWGLAQQTGAFPPLGRGGIGGPAGQAMLNAGLAGAGGTTPADVGAGLGASRASFRADSGSLANLQKLADTQHQQIRRLESNSQLLKSRLSGIPDTGTMLGNKLTQDVLRQLGSRGVAEYQTALSVVQPEAARILHNGPSGGGTLTVESKRDLQAIINGTFTKNQLLGVLDVLTTDAHNSGKSFDDQIAEIRGRMGGGNKGAGTSVPGTTQSRIPAAPASQYRPGGFFDSNRVGGPR